MSRKIGIQRSKILQHSTEATEITEAMQNNYVMVRNTNELEPTPISSLFLILAGSFVVKFTQKWIFNTQMHCARSCLVCMSCHNTVTIVERFQWIFVSLTIIRHRKM